MGESWQKRSRKLSVPIALALRVPTLATKRERGLTEVSGRDQSDLAVLFGLPPIRITVFDDRERLALLKGMLVARTGGISEGRDLRFA